MVNDISIATFILGFMIVLATVLPFVQTDFNQTVVTNDIDRLTEDINRNNFSESGGIFTSAPSGWEIFKSFFLVFFWSFGALPLLIEIPLLLMKIVLVLIIARNVWIGGGG